MRAISASIFPVSDQIIKRTIAGNLDPHFRSTVITLAAFAAPVAFTFADPAHLTCAMLYSLHVPVKVPTLAV
jgi:hypothetical protein